MTGDGVVREGIAGPTDELAVRDLAHRYAICADSGDGPGFAAVFSEDARLEIFRPGSGSGPSVSVVGVAALGELPLQLAKRYAVSFHMLGSTSYDLGGDAGSGIVYCVAHHLDHAEDQEVSVSYLRYRDDYMRRAEGWRIVRRVGFVAWTETRPVASRVSGAEKTPWY